jgi:hypothetical protein
MAEDLVSTDAAPWADTSTFIPTFPRSATATERNYAQEMRELIDMTTQGRYTSASAAQEIVNYLREHDPDLLHGWLDAQAVHFVRVAISNRDHSARAYNRTAASRSVFRKAAEDFDNGDEAPLRSNFLDEVYVIEAGVRMPLRQMTSVELSFVADDFGRSAKESLWREAFLRALAKKCGTRTVEQVFDEETIAKLWISVAKD